ncbi:shTK domain protein [Oesophagostomum dentatum]|uniref:ShTK domain protein n=1 Tax=Oesophagostomum dentatum TaxID=61180 RepID=A0A0B1TRF5_OESDE|nr:shTK domain protein [Oesophagostomum dentatum]
MCRKEVRSFKYPLGRVDKKEFLLAVIDCVDDPAVNCTKLLPQCSDPHYDDLLNNCDSWNNNGFCNSTFYSTETKQTYCNKTCGFCS